MITRQKSDRPARNSCGTHDLFGRQLFAAFGANLAQESKCLRVAFRPLFRLHRQPIPDVRPLSRISRSMFNIRRDRARNVRLFRLELREE
jgi:hypothetical protein